MNKVKKKGLPSVCVQATYGTEPSISACCFYFIIFSFLLNRYFLNYNRYFPALEKNICKYLEFLCIFFSVHLDIKFTKIKRHVGELNTLNDKLNKFKIYLWHFLNNYQPQTVRFFYIPVLVLLLTVTRFCLTEKIIKKMYQKKDHGI